MRVSWNVEKLKRMTDKELSKIFNDKTTPSLTLVYLKIGREMPIKNAKKVKEKK
jgi:hypothetical protein